MDRVPLQRPMPLKNTAAMNPVAQRTADGVSWHVLPDWGPVLLGPEGLRLEAWRDAGQVQVVKDAVHRAVYWVRLPDREFYVKHYRCPRFWDVARHVVRASSARREWQKSSEVARRGIATARPVAWGDRVGGGLVRDNFLVTEAIPFSCTLQQYGVEHLPRLPEPQRSAVRRKLLESFARLAATMHRAGIWHDDFHDGNVLVRFDGLSPDAATDASALQLCLIDLSGVRLRSGPLGWSASRQNLVVLSSAWSQRATLAEQWRFWRIYCDSRPELGLADRRDAAAAVANLGQHYGRRLRQQRDKRSLRTNRDFTSLRGAGGEAHGVADLPRERLRSLLQSPDALLWKNLDRPIKLGHSSLMVEAEILMAAGPCHVALKRCRPRNLLRAIKGLFRPGRARCAWSAGHALLAREIPTPRPLAVWEPRRRRLAQVGYLATQWIDGAENLHLWGWRMGEAPLLERLSQAALLARVLGRLIGRMHAEQIAHRDLKASNILLAPTPHGIEAYLVDVDGIRITKRLRDRQRNADLARLAVSMVAHPWVNLTIRARFLREYVAQFPPGEICWKSLWREIAHRSDRLTRRKRRRREQIL